MRYSAQYSSRGSSQTFRRSRLGFVRFQALEAQSLSLRDLKRQLVQNRLASVNNPHHAVRIQWAADEASSLSWDSGYPLLLFPALFEECANSALLRAKRQEAIHQRSRELLGLPRFGSSPHYD